MDNLDFGPGFGIIVLLLTFFGAFLNLTVVVACVHFLSKLFSPVIAQWFGFKPRLTGNSVYDVFSYALSWLFIAPAIGIVLDLMMRDFFSLALFAASGFGDISALNYCLLGLTVWRYNSSFTYFELNSVGKIIVYGIAFLVLGFISNILRLSHISTFNLYFAVFLNHLIPSVLFGLLTVYLIRRNKLPGEKQILS